MSHDQKKTDNVVDIAAARRRSRTLAKKEKEDAKAAARGANGANGARKGGSGGTAPKPSPGRSVVAAIQLVIFLAGLFYMTQLCRGPG